MISSAVAVHLIGTQSLFQFSMNDSMSLTRSFTELCVPRRITFRVMTPFQISIWFTQEAPLGGRCQVVSAPPYDTKGVNES